MAVKDHNDQALVQSGLSPTQAALYSALVQHGALPASKASIRAGVGRTLAYKGLGELEELGLVIKKDMPGTVAIFSAAHPLKLKEVADKRFEEAKDAKKALEGTLAKLISDFNTVAGQPGVRILEGVAGIAEMLEDQLNERQPVRLIRSPKDVETPELDALMSKTVAERVKLDIPIQIITPLSPFFSQKFLTSDKERMVERRIVPSDALPLPAAIAIYANKVALTAYENSIITTVIENTAIRQTFEMIFDYIWAAAKPEHERILVKINT